MDDIGATPMIGADIREQAERVLDALRQRGLMLTTAESCTGGLIAAALTAIPGSSEVFDRGFVTYSNASKTAMLDVPKGMLDSCGAVSAETAQAMAEGALGASDASVALSVTGIAGPGGGTKNKPVGLVFLACATDGMPPIIRRRIFAGERDDVRHCAVNAGFELILQMLENMDDPQKQGAPF